MNKSDQLTPSRGQVCPPALRKAASNALASPSRRAEKEARRLSRRLLLAAGRPLHLRHPLAEGVSLAVPVPVVSVRAGVRGFRASGLPGGSGPRGLRLHDFEVR